MKELTLEIINKIIENCKDSRTFVSMDDDQDYEFWRIKFLDNGMHEYTLIHFFEYEDSKEKWIIIKEEQSQILDDYECSIDDCYDNYNLLDFHEEYDKDLDINKEVIDLVIKYNNCELIL